MGRGKAISMSVHIGRCAASGISASAYCRMHQLSLATFYYWRKKVAVPNIKATFKEIKLTPALGRVISIQFSGGTVIHIEGEVSAAYLRELAGC